MDVLWFRLSHKDGDSPDTFGHIEAGRLMVMFDRGDYWQCAYIIPKGGIERMKSEGLEAFRGQVVEMSPFLSDRVDELKSWDDVKLLSVTVDRLQEMVAARPHLHRRCGACDVADRRRGRQYGGAGRGRRGQPARRTASHGQGDGRGSSGHRRATHSAHAIHPGAAARHPAADHQPRSQAHERPKPPAVLQALRRLSNSAPHPGAVDRARHSSRTRADARSGGAGFRGRAASSPVSARAPRRKR